MNRLNRSRCQPRPLQHGGNAQLSVSQSRPVGNIRDKCCVSERFRRFCDFYLRLCAAASSDCSFNPPTFSPTSRLRTALCRSPRLRANPPRFAAKRRYPKRILLWSHRPLRCSDFAPPQQKKVWLALMSGLALIALLSMAGCGGGVNNGSRNQTIDSGRALGTYAVTITGASGATQPERFRYAYGSLSRPAVDRNLRREPDIQRVPPICQTPIPSGY